MKKWLVMFLLMLGLSGVVSAQDLSDKATFARVMSEFAEDPLLMPYFFGSSYVDEEQFRLFRQRLFFVLDEGAKYGHISEENEEAVQFFRKYMDSPGGLWRGVADLMEKGIEGVFPNIDWE